MGSLSYVYVRWIGAEKPDEGILEDMTSHLEEVFAAPARIMPNANPAPDFYDPARGQYSSTKTLRWVLQHLPGDVRKIVAITDGDLFIPVLTFVFGEAQLGGPAAVVSTARLRVDQNGFPCPSDTFRARLRKECVHELGHAFGLAHCTLSRCAMNRSNSVSEVDVKSWLLCRECRAQLSQLSGEEE